MAKSSNTRVKFLVVWAEGLPVYMVKYGRTPGGPEMGRPARNVPEDRSGMGLSLLEYCERSRRCIEGKVGRVVGVHGIPNLACRGSL